MLRVSRIASHNLLKVSNRVCEPVLLPCNAPQLIVGIDFVGVYLHSSFKTLPRCIEFPSLLMNQAQIVMRGGVCGIQSCALKVLFESSFRAVLTHDFTEVAAQKHKKHHYQKRRT